MKQNEEEVQYYYDSRADQWWCYDEQQQCWVPWQEEEQDEAGGAEPSAAEAGVTDAATANGAPAAEANAAIKHDGEGLPSASGSAEQGASDAINDSAPPEEGTVSELHRVKECASVSTRGAAESTTERGKQIVAQNLTVGVEGNEESATGGGITVSTDIDAQTPRTGSEGREGTHRYKTNNNSRRGASAITGRATGKAAGGWNGKEKAEKLQREDKERAKKQKEVGKQDEVSAQAGDNLRSALESLATTPSLDEALLQMGSSSNLDRFRSLSVTGRGAFPAWLQEQAKAEAKAGHLGKAVLRKRSSLQSNVSGKGSTDQNPQTDDEEDVDEDAVGDLPNLIKQDPIVRRSTRMLTFKDKGGLSGCLREAAKQRNNMIMEAGGYIPGTEQYRQEAWKQRARELASQTHERNQRRWQEAAKKVFDAAGGKSSAGKAVHFTNIVEKARRKSEADKQQMSRALEGMTHFSSDAGDNTPAEPPRTRKSVGPEFLAANLLLKPQVDLREQRRRSSGFPGGQHGHVRFADAAFKDPNSQLQMQDLLAQQSKWKPIHGEEDLAANADETRNQHPTEEGE